MVLKSMTRVTVFGSGVLRMDFLASWLVICAKETLVESPARLKIRVIVSIDLKYGTNSR